MDFKHKVAIVGCGSFGTALAVYLAKEGHLVKLYTRRKNVADSINSKRRHPTRFVHIKIPTNITASINLADVLREVCIVILAIPTSSTPNFIQNHKNIFDVQVPLIITAKGLLSGSNKLLSENIKSILGTRQIPQMYLSGPNFARDIIEGCHVNSVLASKDKKMCKYVHDILHSRKLHLKISDDIVGIQICGALKNPIAIIVGMMRGMGMSASTVAGVITRCFAEMGRVVIALGGQIETLLGYSGVGDIMLTCFSTTSRNYRMGVLLAKGIPIQNAVQQIGEVVEGVRTSNEMLSLSHKYKINLPILTTLHAVLKGEIRPSDAISLFINQTLKNI